MPKNTQGGNKAKKGKNSGARIERALQLVDASGSQFYGVIDTFGGSTAQIRYLNTKEELEEATGFIRNSLRKWCKRFKKGDIVLISIRDFEKGKVDIMHKYNDDEARELRKRKLLLPKFIVMLDSYGMTDNMKQPISGQPVNDSEDIYFDENHTVSSDESDEDDSGAPNDIQKAMNEVYMEERMSDRHIKPQKDKNSKYMQSTNGKPKQRDVLPQQGTREMPPSDTSDTEADPLAYI